MMLSTATTQQMFTMVSSRRILATSSLLVGRMGASSRVAAYTPCVDPAIHRFFTSDKRLTEETISPALVNMRYAVRGPIVRRADDIQHDIEEEADKTGNNKFDHVLFTNLGNPHSVGQPSLTWPREVMALCNLPDEVGVDNPKANEIFAEDVIDRARQIKRDALQNHGTGAYSHSQGAMPFREDIARFIENRDDGVKSDPNNIFMTNGASTGIDMILQTLLADETCGVMIPIPQYPLYTASIALRNGNAVSYYLDEEKGWSIDINHLEESLAEARGKGINVNSFVLINPGNPTGQVLTRQDMHDVVKFCARNKLVLLADEVYQANVYDDNAEFVSAKRAAFETGLLEQDAIELVSFHSTSKGLYGECGHRGGYMEVVGWDEKVVEHLYKLASSCLCPNLDGQIMMDLMVRGPEPGSESFDKHEMEKSQIFESLKRRARTVAEGLNSIPGFSCQPAQGAMYCFPSVRLPDAAIREAQAKGQSPDTLYALSILENTGICVVPASGFHQKPGRYGFRTTFLPSEEEMFRAVELLRRHHEDFCRQYDEEPVAA